MTIIEKIGIWLVIMAGCGVVAGMIYTTESSRVAREQQESSIRSVPVMYCVSSCVQSMTRHDAQQLLGGASAAVVGTSDVVSYCQQVYVDGCYIGGYDAVLELHPSNNNLPYNEYMGVRKLEQEQ